MHHNKIRFIIIPHIISVSNYIHINKMPLPDSRKALEATSKRLIGASSAVSETLEKKKKKKISKNDIVYVQSRTWPGINKSGGVARVSKVHKGGNSIKYDVTYVLGGREEQVDEAFVTLKDDNNTMLSSSRAAEKKRHTRQRRAATNPTKPNSAAADTIYNDEELKNANIPEDILQWARLSNPKKGKVKSSPGTPAAKKKTKNKHDPPTSVVHSASGLFPQEVTVIGCGLSDVNGVYKKEDNGGFPTYAKRGMLKRQVVLYKLTGPPTRGTWFIGYSHAASDDCLCLYYSKAGRNVPPKDGWESYSSTREECGHTVPKLTYRSGGNLNAMGNDIILRITPYLNSKELLNLALTCSRFGGTREKQNSSDYNPFTWSLMEEAARQIINSAKEEERNTLPRYNAESWLSVNSELELLRSPLAFDTLFGDDLDYVDGDKTRMRAIGGSLRTGISNHIMRGGKHYVSINAQIDQTNYQEEITAGAVNLLAGVMRPVNGEYRSKSWRSYSPLRDKYWPELLAQRNVRWSKSRINCCMYESRTGRSCWSDWQTSNLRTNGPGIPYNYSNSWVGSERCDDESELGMLLDLDEGTLSVYKDGRKLGVLMNVSSFIF